MKSDTIDISNYTIKDVPGSTGRLDVIARCIIAALFENSQLDQKVKIYIFLDKYGNYLLDPRNLRKKTFPRNELLLTDLLVRVINHYNNDIQEPMKPYAGIVKFSKDIMTIVNDLKDKDFDCFILSEDGTNIKTKIESLKQKKNLAFIVGNQSGKFLNSPDLNDLKLSRINLGSKTYLASTSIRLLKLNLML